MTDYSGNKNDDFKKLPKAAREFTCFIDLIIDEALKNLPDHSMQTYIRCHKKKCFGTINTQLDFDNDIIIWKCSDCNTGGTIKGCLDF